MGGESQCDDIGEAHGFITKFIDVERIDGDDELGLECLFDSKEDCIFGLIGSELAICFNDLVASSIGKNGGCEAWVDGARKATPARIR